MKSHLARLGFVSSVVAVVLTANASHAFVVCVRDSPKGGPVRIRSACKSTDLNLGTFEAFKAVMAASSGGGGASALEFTGGLKFFSRIAPVNRAAQQVLSGERYCREDGYPGAIGNDKSCTADADCNNTCVAGYGQSVGTPCATNTDCDSQGKNDGRCALTAVCQEFAVFTLDGSDAYFSGFNVHIRNGRSDTGTAGQNGLGNLIVGYNEGTSGQQRSGSHNLVIGPEHEYVSVGGLIAGFANTVAVKYASVSGGQCNYAGTQTAPHCIADTAPGVAASISGGQQNRVSSYSASVSGGAGNDASGDGASVSGGAGNDASGDGASVSGGYSNVASGKFASVSGGGGNKASGPWASVSGGDSNVASASNASVSGGGCNYAGIGTAPGCISEDTPGHATSIGGGAHNVASGTYASVSGGELNEASSRAASVSGGFRNRAEGSSWTSVSGGSSNTAWGQGASVSGGLENSTDGDYSSISGGLGERIFGYADWQGGTFFSP